MSGQDYGVPLQVGDVVYEGYRPQALGRVVAVRPRKTHATDFGRYAQECEVLWRKTGQRSWHRGIDLQSLSQLIADHEKKLAGHKKRLQEMQTWNP